MRSTLVVLTLVSIVGCDPGWPYHAAPSPAPIPGEPVTGIEASVVEASVFAGSLTTIIAITNTTQDTVVLGPVNVLARDRRDSLMTTLGITLCSRAVPILIAPSQECRVRGYFTVNPGGW